MKTKEDNIVLGLKTETKHHNKHATAIYFPSLHFVLFFSPVFKCFDSHLLRSPSDSNPASLIDFSCWCRLGAGAAASNCAE